MREGIRERLSSGYGQAMTHEKAGAPRTTGAPGSTSHRRYPTFLDRKSSDGAKLYSRQAKVSIHLKGVHSMRRTREQQEPSEDGYDAQVEHAKAHGIKRVSGLCLKKIVNPEYRHKAADIGGLECPYELRLDHPRMWRTADGELFATADPYNVQLEDLEPLLAISRELGLDVAVDGRSLYYPGHTFTITITRRGSRAWLGAPDLYTA